MKTLSAFVFLVHVAPATAQLSKWEAIALEGHPAIATARSEQQALSARGETFRAPYRPMVSLTGVAAAGNDSAILATAVEPRNYLMAEGNPVGIGSAMAMLPLFVGGRDTAAARAAAALRLQGAAMVSVAMQQVMEQVRVAFAEARAAEELLAASGESVEAARSLLTVTEQRFAAGSVPEAFVLAARASMSNAERRKALAEAELASKRAALREAAGIGQQEDAPEIGEWDRSLEAPATLAEALTAAKERPEIRAARAQAEAQRQTAAIASRSRLPELSLVGMATGMATELNSEVLYKVGLVLSVPLVDGGMRRAESAEKRAMAEGTEHEMRRIELQVEREVAQAWARWSASPAVVEAAEAEVASAQEAHRIAMIRYAEGRSPQVEADQSAAELHEARAARAEAHAFRRIAWASLMRAIGKKPDQEDQNKL